MKTNFPFKLGLKPSRRDDRDLRLCIEPNKVLPIKYDIPVIRCIYSQEHNDCSANVICNQIMSLKDWNDNTYPSKMFQYWVSREIAGNTDESVHTEMRTTDLQSSALQMRPYVLIITVMYSRYHNKKPLRKRIDHISRSTNQSCRFSILLSTPNLRIYLSLLGR